MVRPAADVLIDNITRRPVAQKVTDMVRPWPLRNDTLVLELDDSQFTDAGATVKVTIEASFDGGVTFEEAHAFLCSGRVINPDPNFPWRSTKPSIRLGYKRGTEARPVEGEIYKPTHIRISIEPARGVPVIGVRTNL